MCTSDGRHKKWNETQYNDKQKISFNAQTGRFLVTGFWQTIFFVFSATRVHINTQHKQTKKKVNKQTDTKRTNWLAILIVLMMLDIRNVCVILGHVCDRTYGQSNCAWDTTMNGVHGPAPKWFDFCIRISFDPVDCVHFQ